MEFWIRQLHIGPVHLSIVRNRPLARLLERRIGGFLTWDRRWLCATLRLGSLCFNVDADWRR
jgi:hypothetical protein